jgi:hypothetical protein
MSRDDVQKVLFNQGHGRKSEQLVKSLRKEETEELDELSKKTLDSYKNKAVMDLSRHAGDQSLQKMMGGENSPKYKKHGDKIKQRAKGIHTVMDKLSKIKEETEELDEKAAVAKSKQTVLVTAKGNKSGGGVMRIKKSDYDPNKHSLAEDQVDEGIMKTIKRGLQGWSNAEHPLTGSANKPKDVVARTRAMDSASLKKLADRTDAAKHSPAHLQSKAAQRELRQRNEETEIDERKMTGAEMDKREHIVKGMKKKLSDFRARYGKRAKDVMYATATKNAMKEDLAQPLIGSMDPTKEKKKKKEMEQTAPAVTPITLPNFSADVNTGRNV